MSLPTPPESSARSTASAPSLSEIVAAGDDAWPEQALSWYRCALELLIGYQQASVTGPPARACDAALLRGLLDPYIIRYLEGRKGLALDANQRKTLDDAFSRIVDHNLQVATVLLHGRFTPDRLVASTPVTEDGASTPRLVLPEPADALLGPITWDIASLTRDASIVGNEAFVLDVTIRYWERARKSGLPVDADFGAFYRAVEWMGLHQQLAELGRLASVAPGGPPASRTSALVAAIHATTSRYIELRAFQRFVERVEGFQVAGSYVIGRG